MKRKHAYGLHAKQVKSMLTAARNNFIPGCFEHNDEFKPYTVTKTDDVITARLQPVDPVIKPLCEVNYTIPKAWLDELKLKESDKKEPLVDEHENTSETQQTVTFPTPQTEHYYSENAIQQLREENEQLKARVSEAYHKMEVIMRLLEI